MPAGKAINRPCLICNLSYRSDHLKRHVQRIHPKQSIPAGWTEAPDHPRVWMCQKVINTVTGAVGYPNGLCLDCGDTIDNRIAYTSGKTDVVRKATTIFTKHTCRGKQIRNRVPGVTRGNSQKVTPIPTPLAKEDIPILTSFTVAEKIVTQVTPTKEEITQVDLSELYESILDRIDRRPTLSLETKQEVTAVLECLQEDEDYKDDYNMMIELSFITISEKLDERDKKIAELQQQIRRLDQENWKLKSQIPDPQDEQTLVITD